MNLDNILEYQKVDRKLFDVERKIHKSPYMQKAKELEESRKKALGDYREQEVRAQRLIKEIEEIRQKYELTQNKLKEMLSKDLDSMNLESLKKVEELKEKIEKNLDVLEKVLQKTAVNIKTIISERISTTGQISDAKAKIDVCKTKSDEEQKELLPEKEKLEKELRVLEKDVEGTVMAEYKRKRQDGIFPVFVELEMGSFCGGCHMEQPKVALSRIKEKGYITCENERCKKFIYQKK